MGAADEVERPSSSLQEQRRLLDDTPVLTYYPLRKLIASNNSSYVSRRFPVRKFWQGPNFSRGYDIGLLLEGLYDLNYKGKLFIYAHYFSTYILFG